MYPCMKGIGELLLMYLAVHGQVYAKTNERLMNMLYSTN